ARMAEKPLPPAVMPPPRQPSPDQHPAHRAPPTLSDQPHHQRTERGEARRRETRPEHPQQAGQRRRYSLQLKHRRSQSSARRIRNRRCFFTPTPTSRSRPDPTQPNQQNSESRVSPRLSDSLRLAGGSRSRRRGAS